MEERVITDPAIHVRDSITDWSAFAGRSLSPVVSQKPIITALLRYCHLLEVGLLSSGI